MICFPTLAAFLHICYSLLMLCRKIAIIANVCCYIETNLNKVSCILYLESAETRLKVCLVVVVVVIVLVVIAVSMAAAY